MIDTLGGVICLFKEYRYSEYGVMLYMYSSVCLWRSVITNKCCYSMVGRSNKKSSACSADIEEGVMMYGVSPLRTLLLLLQSVRLVRENLNSSTEVSKLAEYVHQRQHARCPILQLACVQRANVKRCWRGAYSSLSCLPCMPGTTDRFYGWVFASPGCFFTAIRCPS